MFKLNLKSTRGIETQNALLTNYIMVEYGKLSEHEKDVLFNEHFAKSPTETVSESKYKSLNGMQKVMVHLRNGYLFYTKKDIKEEFLYWLNCTPSEREELYCFHSDLAIKKDFVDLDKFAELWNPKFSYWIRAVGELKIDTSLNRVPDFVKKGIYNFVYYEGGVCEKVDGNISELI